MFGHRTIEDIHKKALQHPEVRDTWAKSIEPICKLLTQTLPCVLVKGKNFGEGNKTAAEIREMKLRVIESVDPNRSWEISESPNWKQAWLCKFLSKQIAENDIIYFK